MNPARGMQIRATFANAVWYAASLAERRRYRAAVRNPDLAQWRLLRRCLVENADTAIGRQFDFANVHSVAEYQARVPPVTYDELEPFIRRVASGERDVLTAGPVRRLVPSSGSTSAMKLVPYTPRLQQEIARGVGAWIADLYTSCPDLMRGPAYWSITPPARSLGSGLELTYADNPGCGRTSIQDLTPEIGFADDSAYLGGLRGALIRAALAVPPGVVMSGDIDEFRRQTLVHLLRARALRLMSVWHPSFLSLLLDELSARWSQLVDLVTIADRARGAELRRLAPDNIGGIWPRLRLISCWGDGPAGSAAISLAARVPGVTLQRKGLIATEGVVTIPFNGLRPVAIRSHFVEFLSPDGRAHLVHELRTGVEYTVVLTTGGGLYRYRLADRVTVDGWVERTPSLRFIGKDDRTSDRFGEKLSDAFVANVLDRLFAPAPRPGFAMLAPEHTHAGLAYALFVSADAPAAVWLEQELEAALRRNPHYAWCVDVGQLKPARVVAVGAGADRAYVDACVARGQRLGDVKPVSLHTATGWAQVLAC